MSTDLKANITAALAGFADTNLRSASINLLGTLGYTSDKTLNLDGSPDAFLDHFSDGAHELRKDKALFDRWKSIHILFQFTDTEVQTAGGQSMFAFDSAFNPHDYQSYLFVAIDLKPPAIVAEHGNGFA